MNETDKFDEDDKEFENDKKEGFYQPDSHPESQAETIRKSSLAYGAVTVLIVGILLFMAIGWAIDKYFHTTPWGIVVGIIFGAIVGFYQFIRLTSEE